MEAEIRLMLNKEKYEMLENIDLAEYFITSKAEKTIINDEQVKVEVKKAEGKKCERCWKILEKKCNRTECPFKNDEFFQQYKRKKNEFFKRENIFLLFL